uniref:Uncharacterized protein n=1 Tax=Oryza brachyantha TaxID=4533 RepID=J3L9Q7_ORYBR
MLIRFTCHHSQPYATGNGRAFLSSDDRLGICDWAAWSCKMMISIWYYGFESHLL